MRRTKPQLIFLSGDHPQCNDAASKETELCGVSLQKNSNLRSILTAEHLELLGEIDENWFETVSAKECSGAFEESKKLVKGTSKKQQDENSASALSTRKDGADNSHACQQETPVRKDFRSTTSGLDSSPPLFTPDQKGKTLEVTDGVTCHSTPRVNTESQTFSPLKWTGQDPDGCKVESVEKFPSVGISPVEEGVYNPREDTPQLMRNLLHIQTPSTANKTQETLSMSAFQQTLPTPQRLSKSLGAEVEDCNLSWTSSMATPYSARKATERETSDARMTCVTRGTDSPQTWKPIIAKVLFAGSEKKTQKIPKSLEEEEGSSEALQSLHFSSTEDEAETSDQEKDGIHQRKRDHGLKGGKKDSSHEIKRMRRNKDWEETPLKMKMDSCPVEKLKIVEELKTGSNEVTKVGDVEEAKITYMEDHSPGKKQKMDKEVDCNGRKEMPRVLEVKMEKDQVETFDHQPEGVHEEKSVGDGDCKDFALGKNKENEEWVDGKDAEGEQKEGNVKCDEHKEILSAEKTEIELKGMNDMEKLHLVKTVGETNGGASEHDLEISTVGAEKGLEEVELQKETDSTSNQMEGCCEQINDRKVRIETKYEEKDLQQVQNEHENNRAVNKGFDTDSTSLTVDDGERGEALLDEKPSEGVVSDIAEDRKLHACRIPEEEDEPRNSSVKASCGGEDSSTTLSSTQKWQVKEFQEPPQTPDPILQKDKECTDEVEGWSSVAVMSPSVEAGLYGRLAILAETLNIPLAQMIEADKKARKLQEAALRKASPASRGDVTSTFKMSQEINTSTQRKLLGGEEQVNEKGKMYSGADPSTHEVSGVEVKSGKEESEEQNSVKASVQTEIDSPPSLLPDGSQSSGSLKNSNIADTLAFFLATPPLMQKRKASLGQVVPASAYNSSGLSEKGDERGGSKCEEMPEKRQNLSMSTPAPTEKDKTTVTPPRVDSSPNACLFSPLTPSTTEALLRATDAVSSSAESNRDSQNVEVNNNTCEKGEEGNLLEESMDNVKERSMEIDAECRGNLMSGEPNLQSAKGSFKGGEKPRRLSKDGENPCEEEEVEKDVASGNILHKKKAENKEELDKPAESIDSPVSLLRVGKSLSARRFLYPTSDAKMNVKPRLPTWQQNAVLDESLLQEGDKEISNTTKEEFSEANKCLESGASERKLLNRSKAGPFQTFNSFLQTELKESDNVGCPLQHEDDGMNKWFTEKDGRRKEFEVTNLPSKTQESGNMNEGSYDLNEGFLTDPPGLINVGGSRPPRVEETVEEGGGKVSSSHKVGPGGDAASHGHFCVDSLEEKKRYEEELNEKLQRRCQGYQMSSVGRNFKKSMQILEKSEMSDGRDDDSTQSAVSRMSSSNEIQEVTAENGAIDFPAAKERHTGDLLKIDGKITLHTEPNEMATLTKQFRGSGDICVSNNQTGQPFVGFTSALGKKIEISASALAKAKAFMQKLESDEATPFKPSSSSEDLNSKDVENLINLPVGSTELVKHTVGSKFDSMDGSFSKFKKPAFTGFTSGTGKPIQISAKALKDAELLLEKFESEEQEIVRSNDERKSGMTADAESGKSDGDCQESSGGHNLPQNSLKNTTTCASKNDVIDKGGEINVQSRLSKKPIQGGFTKSAWNLSKKYDPSKNYSHLPKGFRPFKPPARKLVAKEENVTTVLKREKYPQSSLKVECQRPNDGDTKISKDIQEQDISHTGALSSDGFKTKLADAHHGEFEDEESEAHIVREIAAAEEAEMLYDFMKDEDEVVDTQIDTLLTASTEEVNALQEDRLTSDLQSLVKETGVEVVKLENSHSSRDRSEDKMESERNFSEGERQSAISESQDQEDKRKVEQVKKSDISNGPVEISSSIRNLPTTQTMLLNSGESQIQEFVGFQTAKGTKIQISDEALVKAKQFLLDEVSEVSSNPSVSSCSVSKESSKAPEELSPHHKDVKTSEDGKNSVMFDAVHTDYKSVQSHRAKRKSILKNGENIAPKRRKTSNVADVSRSFERGNGKKVRFLEELMENVQEGLEAGMSHGKDDKAVSHGNDWFGASKDKEGKDSFGTFKGTLNRDGIPQPSLTGFQTGSGKQVTISKEALVRARQAWCDEGMDGSLKIEGGVSNTALISKHATPLPKHCSSLSAGTEGQRAIRDSSHGESVGGDELLETKVMKNPSISATSERICMDEADGTKSLSESGIRKMGDFRTEEQSGKLPRALGSGPPGFKTASGTSIKISEFALEKAKKLWSDDEGFLDLVNGEEPEVHAKAISIEETKNSFPSKENPCNKHEILPLENLDKNDKKLCKPSEEGMFSAFQTANGSEVTISAPSLEKMKNQLSGSKDDDRSIKPPDEFKDMQGGRGEGMVTSSIEFQTDKGTQVSTSDAALKRTQQFWSEEISDSYKKQNSNLAANEKFERGFERNLHSKTFSGFQTGRGLKVDISVAALEKAKSLWSDDTGFDPPGKRRKLEGSPDRENYQKKPGATFIGFQTAKGSRVKISQEALKKARSLWSEDEMDLQMVKKPQEQEGDWRDLERPSSGASVGFQTASGTKIAISSTALENAKRLLEDDASLGGGGKTCTIEKLSADCETKHLNSSPVPEVKFCGFQTGNGAKVEISAEAIEKAKQLWTDNVRPVEDKKKGTLLSTNQKSSRMVCGFQTAKGSSVTVSRAALQKAESLFREEEENQSSIDFKRKASGTSTTTKGGQFGGSNAVLQESQISKNSHGMKECYTSMERSIGSSASGSNLGNLQRNVSTSGFLTGRGKAVTISEASLQEAKAKWDDQTDSSSLNIAEKSVSLPHKEKVLQTGISKTLKQNATLGRNSTSSVKTEKGEIQVSEKPLEDASFLQEEKRGWEGNVTNQGKESQLGLSMKMSQGSEDQHFPSRGQSSSVAGLRAADSRGRRRPFHTSQFSPKIQKGGSPGSLAMPNSAVNHLPQKRSPASIFSDRTSPPCPLVSSCSSESTVREPPASARVFKERAHTETSDKEKTHEVCLKQVWQEARTSQLKRIQDKKKTVIKPKPGYLSKHRKGKQRVPLRVAVDQMLPNHYSEEEIFSAGVLPNTLNISAQSSSSYRFKAGDFFSQETLSSPEGILVGDGGRLVPSEDGTLGAEEFNNALLDTPGVDPALVSSDWVENHFRWIVWKLASMEVAYPTHFGGRLLTPDRVLLQLKHRYDREIDQSQRSALKKILERDEAASRRMVLCVAGILEPQSTKLGDGSESTDDKSVKDSNRSGTQCCHLLLTDGWYAVKTIIDTPLAAQVESGKICIGTKLCLSGGELVGSQDACSPLEIPESLYFRISYNSTRRAKFDARLGIQRDPRPFPVPLKSVCGNGGTVGCVDIIIARVYPMQYMEKYPDGSSVFRSLRAEERAAAEFSKAKQKRMEMLYSQIQKKFEEKKIKESQYKKVKGSCKFTQEEVNAMTTGEELYTALTSSLDPGFLESCLTPRQVGLLQDYQRSLQEKQNQGMQEELRSTLANQEAENSLERKVVSLVKIRIADYYERQKGNPPSTSMLTIWRPSEDLISQLIEGKRFQLTNLSASGARFQWNSSNAQLASSRSTRYLEKQTGEEILENIYRPREPVSLQSLARGCHQSMYGEVDVVGLVAAVRGGSGGLQKVYLTDEHCHLVEVRFWNGLKAHYLDDVVQPGKFIAASNLQVRGADSSVLHATELASFSVNPKSKLLQQSLVKLKNEVKDVTAILQLVEESVDNWQKPQGPVSSICNSTVSSSGYSSASNSIITPPLEKYPEKRDQSHLGKVVTHHLVPYEGKLFTSPGTAPQGSTSSAQSISQQSQFVKQTPQTNNRVSQFCRKNSATTNQTLIEDISQENVTSRRRDVQRRSSLLARIPSPPPLTPLPSDIPLSLKKDFRTPVKGSTSSSLPVLSFDSTPKTEKKIMTVSKDSELSYSTAGDECDRVFLFKGGVRGDSEDSLTATQAARLEVCQLTDVEIKELAGTWSQPLSYSSSDENTPEMKQEGCENGGVDEGKGEDRELHMPNNKEKHHAVEQGDGTNKGSLCELETGGENTLILSGSKGPGGKSAQVGGRSLSRRKRERVKQQTVDVTCTKKRKLSQDSCQEKFQSENYPGSSKFLSEKDNSQKVHQSFEVKMPSKPEEEMNVGVSEHEIDAGTSDKAVSSNIHNSNRNSCILSDISKSTKDLPGNIHTVSDGNQVLQRTKATKGNGIPTSDTDGCEQMDERTVGDALRGKEKEQAHEVVNMTGRTQDDDNSQSVVQDSICGRAYEGSHLVMISKERENETQGRADVSENNSKNTCNKSNESASVTKKFTRRGRKGRRSNVNLALLDETNLQESPEHEGLSSRLRKRPRPSYKE